MGFCGVLFPKIVLKVSEIFLQNPPLAAAGRLSSRSALRGGPQQMGPQADRSTRWEAPHPIPAPRRTCRFAGLRSVPNSTPYSPRPAGLGGAAQRTWARRRWAAWPGRGPALAQGVSGRPGRPRGRGPAGSPAGRERSHRAGAAATECPGMSHPERASTSRTSPRPPEPPKTYVSLTHIGSAGPMVGVETLSRACATRGRRGRPGHRARPLVGAQAPGRAGLARARARPVPTLTPDLLPGSASRIRIRGPPGARSCAPTTLIKTLRPRVLRLGRSLRESFCQAEPWDWSEAATDPRSGAAAWAVEAGHGVAPGASSLHLLAGGLCGLN